VPGRSADELSSTIIAAVRTLPHHRWATVGYGMHTLVRSYRLPLRLLRTHTDVCTITVVDAPLGAVVTTIGALTPEARVAVQGVLAGVTAGRVTSNPTDLPTNAPWSGPTAPAAGAPASLVPGSDVTKVRPRPSAPVAPPPSVIPASEMTAVRPLLPAPAAPRTDGTIIRPRLPTPTPPVPAPAIAVLRFDTGQVVEVGRGVVVVGRNPLALATDGQAQTVAVPDPGHTVSKTHFACGQDDRGVWLEDRHSTNGTSATGANGRRATLAPGRRTLVPVDVTVIFGDHQATLQLRS